MKKVLLLLLTLAFISCSDDDGGTVNQQQQLVKTVRKIYDWRSTNPFPLPDNQDYELYVIQTYVTEYENNKLFKISSYINGTTLDGYSEYIYNQQGLLSTIKNHIINNGETLIVNYDYDSQARLTHITQQGVTNAEFIHTDGLITSTRTSIGGQVDIQQLYVNSNNQVYKKITSSSTREYTFNDNDVAIVNSETPTGITGFTAYSYDNEHNPEFLNLENIVGNYKPNESLIEGYLNSYFDYEFVSNKKYLTQFNHNGHIVNLIYTFNEEGLPLIRKSYDGQGLTEELEFVYE